MFGARINRAIATGSDEQLAAANKRCAFELDALQHSTAGGAETALEFRDRIIRFYPGVLAGVVARLECSTVRVIHKLRVQGGHDPRHGHKLKATAK